MRIGEVAARADASTRQVRFYESKGLITSTRGSNNFEGVTAETVAALERERDRMSTRIDVLARNRDAIAAYLSQLQKDAG